MAWSVRRSITFISMMSSSTVCFFLVCVLFREETKGNTHTHTHTLPLLDVYTFSVTFRQTDSPLLLHLEVSCFSRKAFWTCKFRPAEASMWGGFFLFSGYFDPFCRCNDLENVCGGNNGPVTCYLFPTDVKPFLPLRTSPHHHWCEYPSFQCF